MQNEMWGLFAVNSSRGLIALRRDIDDLDVANQRHEFTIIAVDTGDTPLSGSATVVVRVLNCTELDFYYSNPYHYFEINEGSTQFLNGQTGQVIQSSLPPQDAGFYPVDFPQNPFDIDLRVCNH